MPIDMFARAGWRVILSPEPGEHWDLDRRTVWIHPTPNAARAQAHVAAHIDAGHWVCAPHGRFSDVQEREAERDAQRLLRLSL